MLFLVFGGFGFVVEKIKKIITTHTSKKSNNVFCLLDNRAYHLYNHFCRIAGKINYILPVGFYIYFFVSVCVLIFVYSFYPPKYVFCAFCTPIQTRSPYMRCKWKSLFVESDVFRHAYFNLKLCSYSLALQHKYKSHTKLLCG